MFEILNLEYLGYAAATMGGVGFIANIEVPKGRFPDIEDGMARLSILVPINITDELKYTIVSRHIHKDGDISHWGEDITLTVEEISIIEKWCKDTDIKGKAQEIISEYKTKMNEYFILNDKMSSLMENKREVRGKVSSEEMLSMIEEYDSIRKQSDEIAKRLDELKDMKVS